MNQNMTLAMIDEGLTFTPTKNDERMPPPNKTDNP